MAEMLNMMMYFLALINRRKIFSLFIMLMMSFEIRIRLANYEVTKLLLQRAIIESSDESSP